ncbi:MAG: ribose-phosphate diphosphokinase [Thermoplasmata archaeon]|nr:ribose-phosphate diphosphokinase [Thermoplasmata archaeon]
MAAVKVVSGSASVSLAKELARILAADLLVAEVRAFADGELHVRVPEGLSGEEVALVQTTYPNEKLLELFLLQDAVEDAAPARVSVVVPYFGYGRQDKQFHPGEAVSSRAVAKRLEVGADALLTVDVHNERVMDYFDIPALNITGMPALARRFKEMEVEMVLAPDENAARHAETVGDLIDLPWDYLKKERLDSWTVKTEGKALAVKDRKVAIVDDMVSTGGTMVSAARIVQEQGSRGVVAGCVHGLFVGGARERLKAFDEVVATDTVSSDYSAVSVAPEVAEGLKRMG